MKQDITISRKEFQEKVGKSISEGLRKMEACAQDFRKKDADAAMSSMMAGLFHVKECVDAASQMEKELFGEAEQITLSMKEYNEKAKMISEKAAKEKSEKAQEDGEPFPVELLVSSVIAWQLEFVELGRVMFAEEEEPKIKTKSEGKDQAAAGEADAAQKVEPWVERMSTKEIMDAAEDPVLRIHTKMDAMKFRVCSPVDPKEVWTTRQNQKTEEASAELPEQHGLENVAAGAAEEEPKKEQKTPLFVKHIRKRFGF
jgi:hypothetical protein